MSRYTLADNISVFNIKPVFNAFVDEMESCGYRNILRNPNFDQELGGLPYRWISPIDLKALSDYDPTTGEATFTFADQEFVRQDVTEYLDLNSKYAGTFRIRATGPYRIRLYGGANDISCPELNQTSQAEISVVPVDQTSWISTAFIAQTREAGADSTTKFAGPIYFEIISDSTGPNEITFGGLYLTKGAINFDGLPTEAQILDNVRYHQGLAAADSYWELTHDGTEWHRLFNNDLAFELRVIEIFESLATNNYLSAFDLFAGPGIMLIPNLIDGTKYTIQIVNTAMGGGGGGVGDWCREDVDYHAMLEHSDFTYVVYDKFQEDNLVNKFGAVQYLNISLGYYEFVDVGSRADTPSLLPVLDSTGTHYYFYPSWDATGIAAKYSINGGSTWIDCTNNTLVAVASGFTNVKFRFTALWTSAKLYSYGMLFGTNTWSMGSSTSFREHYTLLSDQTAGTVLSIPNGKYYHCDKKSLTVIYNRAVLTVDKDYEEMSSSWSNQVRFLFPMEANADIVFTENYGYVDQSIDNAQKLIALEQEIASLDATAVYTEINNLKLDTTALDARVDILEAESNTNDFVDGTQNTRIGVLEVANATFKPIPFISRAVNTNTMTITLPDGTYFVEAYGNLVTSPGYQTEARYALFQPVITIDGQIVFQYTFSCIQGSMISVSGGTTVRGNRTITISVGNTTGSLISDSLLRATAIRII